MLNISFYINSIMLGVGLAMDAFSVSLANGLSNPQMKRNKMLLIALIFGAFQAAMPLGGWFCVHQLLEKFTVFEKYIPWIALLLLLFIGGKMLIEGIKNEEQKENTAISFGELMVQGVATSIDALSVGFTIAQYSFAAALIESLIIGVVTSLICICGIVIGKKVGTKLSSKASIFGGIVLILIGFEIFFKGVI